MPAADDDLVRPTLAADFDVRRLAQPWDPAILVWAAFFAGPLGGGPLFALNYRRLGRPTAFGKTLVASLVLGVAVAFVIAYYVETHGLDGAREETRLVRLGVQIVGLVLGLVLSRDQKKVYRAYEASGLKPGKLLVPATVSALSGAALQLGLVFAALAIL